MTNKEFQYSRIPGLIRDNHQMKLQLPDPDKHLLYAVATLAFYIILLVPDAVATEIATDSAVLGWLDKVTGRVNTLEAWVDEPIQIGTLSIIVKTCMTRPPEETPENAAFIMIWENKPAQNENELFSGWMFASSPALSAMDHPVYDVWVLDCKDRRRSILE
ncbi:MAG: DUF2155 domain-containing protein [Rhodospirillaceae bacterium]